MPWTTSGFLKQVPDQTGKLVVLTGGNSGIGLEACAILLSKGARVVFTTRSKEKGEKAMTEILSKAKEYNPATKAEAGDQLIMLMLDLSSMESVLAFREQFDTALGQKTKINTLILNAGVMALATRQETKEGFEMQMATNCFGHYVLCCKLMDLLLLPNSNSNDDGVPARIVSLASLAHATAPLRGITLDDLDHKNSYSPFQVYCESKLGNILIAKKLGRLLEENKLGDRVVSVAAHPGITRTELFREGNSAGFMSWLGQSVPMGTTPTILAATTPKPVQGDYAGPFFLDYVGVATWGRLVAPNGRNHTLQDKFWQAMEDKTGVKMEFQG